MENREIAEAARLTVDVIVFRGWAQGKMRYQSGEVCAVKAMSLALGLPEMQTIGSSLYHAFLDYLNEHEESVVGVTFWNDRPERTVDDVLRSLSEFADEIEVTGGDEKGA